MQDVRWLISAQHDPHSEDRRYANRFWCRDLPPSGGGGDGQATDGCNGRTSWSRIGASRQIEGTIARLADRFRSNARRRGRLCMCLVSFGVGTAT